MRQDAYEVGTRQVSVQDIRLLLLKQTEETVYNTRGIVALTMQFNGSNASLLKICTERSTPFDKFLQDRHY
jgi:hypothetical protein